MQLVLLFQIEKVFIKFEEGLILYISVKRFSLWNIYWSMHLKYNVRTMLFQGFGDF